MNNLCQQSPTIEKSLCCPICQTGLKFLDDRYICQNSACSGLFPLVNGIPILIDGDKSIFSIDDFVNERNTLAWSYRAFLASLTKSKFLSKAIELLVRLTAFPFKYLDYISIDNPSTLDSASTYYFIGKKSDRILSDRELIKLYRGAQSI